MLGQASTDRPETGLERLLNILRGANSELSTVQQELSKIGHRIEDTNVPPSPEKPVEVQPVYREGALAAIELELNNMRIQIRILQGLSEKLSTLI